MGDRQAPQYRDPARARWRFQLAAGLAAIAIVLAFIALRFETTPYFISAANSSRPQSYVRMWFDSNDRLLGAFYQGRRLVFESPESNPPRQWHFDLGTEDPAEAQWAVSPDVSHLAWIAGPAIHVAAIGADAKHVSLPLPAGKKALALSLLSDGSVAALLSDLTIRRWADAARAEGDHPIDDWRVPLAAADRAAAEGNDFAVYTSRDDKLTLFSFHDGHWVQAQSTLTPETPGRILFPAPGVAASLTDGRLRIDGATRPGPGAIDSVTVHVYDPIVAGAFEGIFVLPREDDAYQLAPAAPHAIVEAGQKQLAVSGPNGTALFDLSVGTHLNANGRKLSRIALACLLGTLLLAVGPLLINAFLLAFGLMLRKERQRSRVTSTLEKPPPGLIEICHSGDAILWAGAGLSAQSGFPLREAFIVTTLQAAQVEEWIEGPLLPKLAGMCARGHAEDALNELTIAMASQRGALLSHFTATYGRFAAPSRSHELLARLNFQFAVTTNYDILLERLNDEWAESVATLKSSGLAVNGLMKLFGTLQSPSTVVASQAELPGALARSPVVAALREMLHERPLVFFGCSPRGLLADLIALGVGPSQHKRYAVLGVSGSSWHREAAELTKRFGIEVLVCSDLEIGRALPVFLDRLVRDVEKLRRDSMGRAAAAG